LYATSHSYVHLMFATTALSEPQATATNTGAELRSWAETNVPFQENYGTVGTTSTRVNPRYAWVPQWIRNVSVTPATDSAAFSFSSFSADVAKVAVSPTPFASSDSAGDSSATMIGSDGAYTASGLAPGTLYYYRITAGPRGGTVRITGTFTTPGAGIW